MSEEDVLRFSVTDGGMGVFFYELPASFELEALIGIVIGDLGVNVDPKRVRLARDGALLFDNADQLKKTLGELGIKSDDLLLYTVPETPEEKARRLAAALATAVKPQTSTPPAKKPNTAVSGPVAPSDAAARMAELIKSIKVPGPSTSTAAPKPKPAAAAGAPLNADMLNALRQALITGQLPLHLQQALDSKADQEARRMYASVKGGDLRLQYTLRREARSVFDQFQRAPSDEEAFVKKEEHRKQAVMLDENSEEGQKLIQERIQRQLQDEAKMHAYEHTPEHLFSVQMLYINMKINGEPVTAFIDTGAQVSIMSMECAARCKLEHLVDKREDILAHGVGGASRSLGKIHICEVQVGAGFFQCPFEVFADRSMDLLIGLNVLKQHRAVINLMEQKLEFGGGTASVPFLKDGEVEAYKEEMHKRYGAAATSGGIAETEVDSAKLAEVIGLGFDEKDARDALARSGNNVEMAVQNLFHQRAERADGTEKMQE